MVSPFAPNHRPMPTARTVRNQGPGIKSENLETPARQILRETFMACFPFQSITLTVQVVEQMKPTTWANIRRLAGSSRSWPSPGKDLSMQAVVDTARDKLPLSLELEDPGRTLFRHYVPQTLDEAFCKHFRLSWALLSCEMTARHNRT